MHGNLCKLTFGTNSSSSSRTKMSTLSRISGVSLAAKRRKNSGGNSAVDAGAEWDSERMNGSRKIRRSQSPEQDSRSAESSQPILTFKPDANGGAGAAEVAMGRPPNETHM